MSSPEHIYSANDITMSMDYVPGEKYPYQQDAERKAKPVEIVTDSLVGAIKPYRRSLQEEIDEDERIRDLSRSARERWERHLQELDTLQALLERLKSGEQFSIIGQSRRNVKPGEPGELVTVRLAPQSERIPVGESKPLQALNFHGNFLPEAESNETTREAIEALSIRGKNPDQVLDRIYTERDQQFLRVNTVGLFIDPGTERVQLQPQAGVNLGLRADRVRASGVSYVGQTPHFARLETVRIPQEDFRVMRGFVEALLKR